MPKILITGSLGQIGSELSQQLNDIYGVDNVICSDLRESDKSDNIFERLDVTDKERFEHVISKHDINWLVHNASILSATGEQNPHLAMKVNFRGFENAIEISRTNDLRILSPSSIAAFGDSTPKNMTPDITIMKPNTIYGISKVFTELLGDYYNHKWGTDFRSLRYPGIISYKTTPMHGTTDYAVAIFHEAIKNKYYESFLAEDTLLPMMYMPDCLKGTIELLQAENSVLTQRTYNLSGFSFSPSQLSAAIKEYIPEFKIGYKPDYRQEIADSWPNSIDDSIARRDWGWQPSYSLDMMVEDMLTNVSEMLNIALPNHPVN